MKLQTWAVSLCSERSSYRCGWCCSRGSPPSSPSQTGRRSSLSSTIGPQWFAYCTPCTVRHFPDRNGNIIMGLGVCRFSPTGPGRLGGKAKDDQKGEGGRLGLSSPLLCLIVCPPIRYLKTAPSSSRALPSISLKMLRDKMRWSLT